MGMEFDHVVRSGLIYDGTGGPAFQADVAVRHGRITAVGVSSGRGACQLGVTFPDSRIRVSAWVKNLTNQAVPMFLQSASNPGGYSFQIEQPPRTYGFTVQYRF